MSQDAIDTRFRNGRARGRCSSWSFPQAMDQYVIGYYYGSYSHGRARNKLASYPTG